MTHSRAFNELIDYISWLEAKLDKVDDGNLFGCCGWRHGVPSEFKPGPKLRHWGEDDD
jgi:hypothetical protein